MSNAIKNQISIVLNFSLSVGFRFANADPMVTITIAVNINSKCTRAKKVVSIYFIEVLKLLQKYLIIELWV